MATTTVTKTHTVIKKSKMKRKSDSPFRVTRGKRLGSNDGVNTVSPAILPYISDAFVSSKRLRTSKLHKSSESCSSLARKGSDPSSSNNSSSRSGDTQTSSDRSGGSPSTTSEDNRRRSDTPSPQVSYALADPVAPFVEDPTPSNIRDRRTHHRRAPKKLSLSFVPKAHLNAIAYRERLMSPKSKQRQGRDGILVDPLTPTDQRRGGPVLSEVVKRPSPKSLREARIKRFSQPTTLHSEHSALHDSHSVRPFASYIPTPERSRSNSRVSINNSGHQMRMFKGRANVNVTVANVSTAEIASYVRDGYVVDIISPFIVRKLPMSRNTRALVKRYVRWGQAQIDTGLVKTLQANVVDNESPWQQWAYISRLNMSDIGRDGRRRTLTRIDESVEDESWTVLLVPLRKGQADNLRGKLQTRLAGDEDTSTRRRSLGSEIANFVEKPNRL